MLKFEIAFDENKVLSEKKYNLEKMYNLIDSCFADYNLKKIDKGVYCDCGMDKDFANMWNIVWALADVKWFEECVSKIIWHNNYSGKEHTEDVLTYFKENNIGLFKKNNMEFAV